MSTAESSRLITRSEALQLLQGSGVNTVSGLRKHEHRLTKKHDVRGRVRYVEADVLGLRNALNARETELAAPCPPKDVHAKVTPRPRPFPFEPSQAVSQAPIRNAPRSDDWQLRYLEACRRADAQRQALEAQLQTFVRGTLSERQVCQLYASPRDLVRKLTRDGLLPYAIPPMVLVNAPNARAVDTGHPDVEGRYIGVTPPPDLDRRYSREVASQVFGELARYVKADEGCEDEGEDVSNTGIIHASPERTA